MEKKQSIIISVNAQKGGAGKTSTVYNVAGALKNKGCKVLCIDLDPQCNLSTTLGYLPNNEDDTICDAIFRICSGRSYDAHSIVHSSPIGIDYVPSSKMLRTLSTQIENSNNKSKVLSSLFGQLRGEYDFILIDNKAAMDIITANALHMSDYAIIVVESGIYSFDGLSDIATDIEAVRANSEDGIKTLGIVYNKATKTKVSKAISDATDEIFGELVFKTKIPYRHSMIEQTIERQLPCVDIKSNTLSSSYESLADEIITRVTAFNVQAAMQLINDRG